jgi:sugar phosphate isomerase/epimerase
MGRLALGAVPGIAWLGDRRALAFAAQAGAAQAGAARGRFGGVEIGAISYSFRQISYNPEDVAKGMRFLGLGVLELEQSFFEPALGAPRDPTGGGQPAGVGSAVAGGPFGHAPAKPAPARPAEGRGAPGGAGRSNAPAGGDANDAATVKLRAELKRWRIAAPWDKVRALGAMFRDAGVDVRYVKFPQLGGAEMSDEEVEYCFRFAQTMGARGLTCEPPLGQAKRLARFATAHTMPVGFHNHSNVTSVEAFGRTGAWEQAFFYSPYCYANVDIGHFTAGNGFPPTAFIQEYHDRITNLHLKDRKVNNGPNVRWGEGDTPITETLQLLKRERYGFPAMIELEYRIPDDSTVMDELARCVQYCKDALA